MTENYYNMYYIDVISDEYGTVYDLYVGDYDSHEYDYYASYEDVDVAHAEGVAACKRAANV